MRHRSTLRRGTLVKRFLQIIASLVLAVVGWFLLGDPEELTAAETKAPTGKVIARFDDVDVTEEEVLDEASRELVELEQQRREVLSKAARRIVHQRLIATEAERRGVTPEALIATEGLEPLAARLEQEYSVEYLGADS